MHMQAIESLMPPEIGRAESTAPEQSLAHNPLIELTQPDIEPPTPFASLASAPAPPDNNFLRFYELRENPFADSVNPAYFYKTETHADAFQRMMLAIDLNVSLGMITGLSGTGKTLVSQLLLHSLNPEKQQAILALVSPGLSKTGLLREILSELSVALPVGINRTQDLLKLLSNYIIDLHQSGKRLVIIIDECHLLSSDCLHVVRTISNIETPECKLITCLLLGEARFAERLKHPSYESLRNRMYMHRELAPMSADECAQYVKFRLMVGGRMTDLFDEAALAAIHRHSGGVCRSINKLCMLAMLEGAMRGKPAIDEETVDACASQI